MTEENVFLTPVLVEDVLTNALLASKDEFEFNEEKLTRLLHEISGRDTEDGELSFNSKFSIEEEDKTYYSISILDNIVEQLESKLAELRAVYVEEELDIYKAYRRLEDWKMIILLFKCIDYIKLRKTDFLVKNT